MTQPWILLNAPLGSTLSHLWPRLAQATSSHRAAAECQVALGIAGGPRGIVKPIKL